MSSISSFLALNTAIARIILNVNHEKDKIGDGIEKQEYKGCNKHYPEHHQYRDYRWTCA